ncbi:MAG: TIGR04283 family arsenosugar biosynthesis glycosyltransferase [Burkholderiales bacterium]
MSRASHRLSVVVPTLNEAEGIAKFLADLQPLRRRNVEIILSDGGSRDGTIAAAAGLADQVIESPMPGRAAQMNAGAAEARADILLFLHADTRLPQLADRSIIDGLSKRQRQWGRFDVRLSGRAWMLRCVETLMNLRSRLTGIATGDQAIFVERRAFESVGGFADIALMEDIELSRRLKRLGPPLCLRETVITSSRRWERDGIWRTIFFMWSLRLRYFFGAAPGQLARRYHGK